MKKNMFSLFRNRVAGLFFMIVTLFPLISAHAAAVLTVEPITWNVIGLDSNDVNAGPNHFPVGVRICNTGDAAATNVAAGFLWDSANALINLRPGTLTTINFTSIPAGGCEDAYFEVEVTRNASAYDTTRRFHVAVTADGGISESTPTPREIYIEHLISQARNWVKDIQLEGASIPNGGTMNLIVGNTYDITVVAATATQGYNQLEAFVTMPNTIFQVLSVTTTYSANNTPCPGPVCIPDPSDKLYADACGWENDPSSLNYRSCTAGDYKAGGDITTTYQVKILQVPGAPLVNPEPLSTLIHDFSGSSYHYNSDYGLTTRFANVISPLTISKSFSPNTIAPDEDSTLTFTIENISTKDLTDINFEDTTGWPAGMAVKGNQTITYTNCGTPSPASVTDGDASLSFTDISVGAGDTCTFSVTVTASSDDAYPNTTENLYLDTLNTGTNASATLVVSSMPPPPSSCATQSTMATWTMEPAAGLGTPPLYTTKATDVSTAVASYTTVSGAQSISVIGNPANSWGGTAPTAGNGWSETAVSSANYFQFAIDTRNYGGVTISLDVRPDNGGNWANPNSNLFIKSSTDGINFTVYQISPGVYPQAAKNAWTTFTNIPAAATGSTTTWFRISVDSGSKPAATLLLDNISFKGCPRPLPPTLAKDFSPASIGSDTSEPPANTVDYTTLTFTLGNPNSTGLTGVTFTDALPDGLVVANPPSVSAFSCGSGTVTADAGSKTISLSGGTLPASSSCSFSVRVQGKNAGSYTNTSNRIISAESGPNKTGGADVGYGEASLTVIDSPVISKAFGSSFIYTGNTTTLSFAIANPNAGAALTGVSFTDTLPTSPDNMVVVSPVNSGAISLTFAAAGKTITRSAGSFITDGFTAGNTISTSSATNPGPFTIATVTATVLTVDEALVNEGPVATTIYKYSTSGCGAPTFAPGAGAGSVAFSNGTIAAGDTCYVTVDVTAPTAGNYDNSVTVSSTNGGTGNTADAGLLVRAPNPAIDILKQAGLLFSGPWASFLDVPSPLPQDVYFRFRVENTGDTDLANVRINDLTLPGLDVSLCEIASLAQYEYQDCVVGPVTVSDPGAYANTANATSDTATSENSTVFYATAGLLLVKSVAESSFTIAGDLLHYSYIVMNNGNTSLDGPVTIADDKIPGGATCPGVDEIGDHDLVFDPGESMLCTATYTVTAGDVTAGSVTNTATATADSVDSNTDSVTVLKGGLPDLRVTKDNDTGGTISLPNSFNWTLLITNPGLADATFPIGTTILSDQLPANATYGAPTPGDFTNISNSGNITCSIDGSNLLSCIANGAGVTIGDTSGSFTVTFSVTPTAKGTLDNASAEVDPSLNVPEAVESNNTDSDTVTVTNVPPVISWDPNNSGGGLDDKGFETTFTEGGAAQAVGDVDAAITDTDDTTMTALTLTAGDVADGASEIFTIGGEPFPQNADKTVDVIVGGTTFHVVYVTATGTFTITENGGDGEMPIADINTLLRGILYRNTSGAPTYGNRTLSAVTNDGDSNSNTAVAKIMVAKVVTRAVIGEFGAFNKDGKVVVRWQTVAEEGTMGFFLYRLHEQNGKYLAVNYKLLPGLLHSPAGGTYSYEDSGAKTDAYHTYRLEEVEISGKRIAHGPWQVFTGMQLPAEAASVKLRKNTAVSGYRMAPQPLSDEQVERSAARMDARLNARANKLAQQGGKAKIYIKEDGLYFIDAGDIARVLNTSLQNVINKIKSNTVRLRCMGKTVATLPAANNKGVYFYGEQRKTLYSEENVYWLDIDKNVKMATIKSIPPNPADDMQYFIQKVRAETDTYPLTNLFTSPQDDFWMWDYVFPGYGRDQSTLSIASPGVMDIDDATLTVALQGATDAFTGNDHQAVIRVNGANVGSVQWDGLSPKVFSTSVPTALLNDGENRVEIAGIRNAGVPYNIFYVNSLELIYPRGYAAKDNLLTAKNNAYPVLRMDGFTGSDIRVFDITNTKRPAVLSGIAIGPSDSGDGTFQVRFAAGSASGRYLALTTGKIKPCILIADQASSLKNRFNSGDYLIVTSGDMMAAAQTLADYRTSKGHVCKVVDVEDVYDEFSYGVVDGDAIKAFFAYAHANWQVRPKYVLLAGDGSFDYHDHKGFGDSVIPALLTGTPDDGLRVTDNLYADVAGNDFIPEFAVGRVPVVSADELLAYINKVIGYEAAFGPWTSQAILAADARETGADFKADSEEIEGLFPDDYLLDRLYLDVMSITNARNSLVASINAGRAYVNFIGHGSMFQIGNKNLFSTGDLSKLKNPSMLPVFTAMTCVAGDFGYPGFDGLSESLVLKAGGGAIAMWAPSGFAHNAQSVALCKGFYSAVFIGGERVLGNAVRRSKEGYAVEGESLHHLHLYNLMGDPALRIK